MTATPVLMLPGLILDQRLFAHQIDALAGDVEVRVPDLAVAETIGDVANSVLDAAPERFALLGLSMGGYVAFEILRRAPERVERLALLDTQARPDTEEARGRRLDQIKRAEAGRFDELLDVLHPMWLAPEHRDDPALRALLRETAHDFGATGFACEQQTIISRPDSRPLLDSIACPSLVLCGRDDFGGIDIHVEMASKIPDASLVVLPRCGHLSTLEQPEAVTAQLRLWLGLG